MTRNAQSVVPDDVANLEQAGLRGLMRVIDAEHPQLRATQIDMDDETDAAAVGASTVGRVGGGRDRLARTASGTRPAVPRLRCAPTSGEPPSSNHEHDGMRLQIRTPGDLESMELTAFDRVPPGPGQIEVAVTASSINFADVLVAFGRYPGFDGQRSSWALISPAW